MAKKKRRLFVLSGLLVFVIMILILTLLDPVGRPASITRNSILRLTPIGTDIEEVINTVNKKAEKDGWRHINISYTHGYNDDSGDRRKIVGSQSIVVFIGYSLTGRTSADISWGFDENGKLIDVYVRKMWTRP